MAFPYALCNAESTALSDGRKGPRRAPYKGPHRFKTGERVYSKRCAPVAAFEGIIVSPRGAGFQVLDPKTGKAYQRDTWDLIPITVDGVEAKDREGVE